MFALKLLITDNTDISKEVLQYLGDDLSSEEVQQYKSNLKEITPCRKEMSKITKYENSSSISKMESYVSMLLSLTRAYSVKSTATFKWKTYGGKYVKTNNLESELACCLYNLAALYTHDVFYMVSGSNVPMETLQQASKKLTVAYSILTYIINNLAYSFIEIKEIPEMNMENLLGIRYFISAEYQFIKAMIGEIKYQSKALLFTCLYTAARDLYKLAAESFKKAKLPLTNTLCSFCEAMTQYCYGYALYYEGYMTPEELEDMTKHGRGKAFFCLNRYFEITKEILQSRVPEVKQQIAPLILAQSNEMNNQRKQILDAWNITRSCVPSSESGFHLKPSYLPLVVCFDYQEKWDLHESIGHDRFALLTSLTNEYMDQTRGYFDSFKAQAEVIQKDLLNKIHTVYYDAYESALCGKEEIPKVMREYLLRVDKEEVTRSFRENEKEYNQLKQQYVQLMNEVDDLYGDLILKMNMNPKKYPENIRQYVENQLHAYIEGKKSAFEELKNTEGPFISISKDPWFVWILKENYVKLSDYIKKNTTVLTEEEESEFNVLSKRKIEFDRMMTCFIEEIDKIHLICSSSQALKIDFFDGRSEDEIRSKFPCYLTTCRDEGNMVLAKYGESRMLMSNLENAIASAGRMITGNKMMEKKLKMFKVIIHQVDKYFELKKYYETTLHTLKHNLSGLMQSKIQLLKYYNIK